jgi:hemoglobin-like flavoprotein
MSNVEQPIDRPKTSVRATLRISKKCSDDIVWLANYYNITQKEVFNRIVGIFLKEHQDEDPSGGQLLDAIVSFAKKKGDLDSDRVRKAQVISNSTHKRLTALTKKYGVPRDALIEVLVSLSKGVIAEMTQKAKEAHTEAFKIINNFWNQAETIEKQLKELLGSEDAILDRFDHVIVLIMNLSIAIENEIEKGIPVDPNEL